MRRGESRHHNQHSETISVDTALVWTGNHKMALPVAPQPVFEEPHRVRLAAIRMLVATGADRARIVEMERDGRLAALERRIATHADKPAKLQRRTRQLYMAEFYHLYVVEILDVGTKIGISNTPLDRLAAHQATARMWKRDLGRVWISVAHIEAQKNERTLIPRGNQKREILDRSFESVVEQVERMPMTRMDDLFDSKAVR